MTVEPSNEKPAFSSTHERAKEAIRRTKKELSLVPTPSAVELGVDNRLLIVYISYVHLTSEDSAMEINVKEARSKLSKLLDRVQGGEEITILRRGKEVARLVPPRSGGRRLPCLREFRATIRIDGVSMSTALARGREEERF